MLRNRLGRAEELTGAPQLTVKQVLELDSLIEARLVGGHSGLDREVTGVNITEMPDVQRWVKPGELLLTSGYPWRADQEQLAKVVRHIADVGASGLLFKVGVHLDAAPQQTIGAANEQGLPLVEIPQQLGYREVIDDVYRQLLGDQLELLEQSTLARANFTDIALNQESVEQVVTALAGEAGNPVCLVDLIDDVALQATCEGAVSRESLPESESDVCAALTEISRRPLASEPREKNLGSQLGWAMPLVAGGAVHGAIALLSANGPIGPLARRELADAADAVCFLMLRRLAMLAGRREAGDLFFDSLFSGPLATEEASERALALGIRLTRPSVVLAAAAPDDSEPIRSRLLRGSLEHACASTPHALGRSDDRDVALALIQVPDGHDVLEKVRGILDVVQAAAQRSGLKRVIFGCGEPGVGLGGVRRSRSQALIACETGIRLDDDSGPIWFGDLGIERLLMRIPDDKLTAQYVEMTVGKLEDEPELMRTLELLLEHGGNKVATAAAIPLHRSSLQYRLDKISEILEVDLSNPERCLELWIALRLRRVRTLTGCGNGHD